MTNTDLQKDLPKPRCVRIVPPPLIPEEALTDARRLAIDARQRTWTAWDAARRVGKHMSVLYVFVNVLPVVVLFLGSLVYYLYGLI